MRLTAEQVSTLLETYRPGWYLADLLLSDEGISRAIAGMQAGCSTRRDVFYKTTSRGIVTYRLAASERDANGILVPLDERLAVPFAAIKAHRSAVGPEAVARLQAAQDAYRAGRRRYPVYRLPKAILDRRVGPSLDIHPDDRQAAAEHFETFMRDVRTPWRIAQQALDDALADAIRTYLTAETGPVQGDLLELLEAS